MSLICLPRSGNKNHRWLWGRHPSSSSYELKSFEEANRCALREEHCWQHCILHEAINEPYVLLITNAYDSKHLTWGGPLVDSVKGFKWCGRGWCQKINISTVRTLRKISAKVGITKLHQVSVPLGCRKKKSLTELTSQMLMAGSTGKLQWALPSIVRGDADGAHWYHCKEMSKLPVVPAETGVWHFQWVQGLF